MTPRRFVRKYGRHGIRSHTLDSANCGQNYGQEIHVASLVSGSVQAMLRVLAACHKSQFICRFIHTSGDVPSSADSRHAVSAVTPRLPVMISFKRFVVICMRVAASAE